MCEFDGLGWVVVLTLPLAVVLRTIRVAMAPYAEMEEDVVVAGNALYMPRIDEKTAVGMGTPM